MNDNIKFSVIINCFNGEKYLRETINSVIAQTYTNWELIFWDNQSTDSSAEIVKSFNDERIRYCYAPRHTQLGEARNLAMKEAKGDFICFLDADDIWFKDFLKSYNNYIKSYEEIGLFYSKFLNDDGLHKWKSTNVSKVYVVSLSEFVRDYKLGMSSVCFSRNIIEMYDVKFSTEFSLIEDFDFFLKIRQYTQALYIPDTLMMYRIHLSNLSKSDKWTLELDSLINKIERKEVQYAGLFDCLRSIRARRTYYCIRDCLGQNRKMDAFCLAIKSCLIDIKCIRYVLYVLFGENLALTIRKILYKNA